MADGKRRSGSGFFVGLLLGLVTGFALALLFAPQPGDATREQLADQSAVTDGVSHTHQAGGDLQVEEVFRILARG